MVENIDAKITLNLDDYNIADLINSQIAYSVSNMVRELKENLVATVRDEFMTDTRLRWSLELSEIDKKIANAITEHVDKEIAIKLKGLEWDIKSKINHDTKRMIESLASTFFDEAKDRMVFLEKDQVVKQVE